MSLGTHLVLELVYLLLDDHAGVLHTDGTLHATSNVIQNTAYWQSNCSSHDHELATAIQPASDLPDLPTAGAFTRGQCACRSLQEGLVPLGFRDRI